MKHLGLSIGLTLAVIAGVRADEAERILKESGVTGGLVVILGCEHLDLMKAAEEGPYLLQFLDTDASLVEKSREAIRKSGVYGRVTATVFDGENLPYIDNLANLVVVADQDSRIRGVEIERILVPGGTVLFKGQPVDTGNLTPAASGFAPAPEGWSKLVKRVPEEIDEWSHWMHAADNNPVANDQKVDVPRNLQWVQGPAWISSHNLNPGVSAMVTSGGRLFSIINEIPPGIKGMEDQWMLTARDAFNGIVLWQRPIKNWGWTHWSEKEESVEMRFVPPFQVMRRLVAAGDMLFVTPGFYSPVHVLDAATGKELRVIQGSEKTFEILYHEGCLYLAANDSIGTKNMIPAISVMAVDPETGRTLWKTGGFRGVSGKFNSLYKHANAFITAGSGNITLINGDELISLDQRTGRQKWRAARPGRRIQLADEDIKTFARSETRSSNIPRYRADQFFPNNCAIAHSEGVIVLTEIKDDPRNMKTRLMKTGYTAAYDATTGEQLWCADCVTFAHFTPPDVFIINGEVWTLDETSKSYVALNLRSGEKQKSYPMAEMIWKAGGHQLCFRNKATTKMIIFGRKKSEFIDVCTGKVTKHAWIKGMCNYGVMPANGMIYYPPHNCSCYMSLKNVGFSAQTAQGFKGNSHTKRLKQGPACAPLPPRENQANFADWPIYRGDCERSGSTPSLLPEKPELKWAAGMSGPLSQVIAADGKLYVAEKDAHRITCLKRDNGTVVWRHTAGGRIDSAPTYCAGRVIAGSRDGHVYCLDAETGQLAWRFRGAPHDASLIAYGQLESVWPVHGSLVVKGEWVYCLAGRSSYLNSGMRLYALDLATGKVVQSKTLTPDFTSSYESEGGLRSDLMVVDGDTIRVRHMQFPADGIGKTVFGGGKSRGPTFKTGISTAGGFLDDSWFNTTSWSVGSVRGQIIAYDERHAFGLVGQRRFGQSCGHDIFNVGQEGYLLFCQSLGGKNRVSKKEKGKTSYVWSHRVPIRGEAILAAKNHLYLAGTRDILDTEDPWGHVEGRKGGVLAVYARTDGTKLAEVSLSSAPAFDGMSASAGNLFVVTRDGTINCYQ